MRFVQIILVAALNWKEAFINFASVLSAVTLSTLIATRSVVGLSFY